jgi:hypothetical protein
MTRYRAHAIGIKHQFVTPNEARALEELAPYEGGDVFPEIAGNPDPPTTEDSNV